MGEARALAVDGQGNVFECELNGNKVRRIDSQTGVITTVAGNGGGSLDPYAGDGGPATAAWVYRPGAIAVTDNGDLYIISQGVVRQVQRASGLIVTVAGGFDSILSEGRTLLAASGSGIVRFDPSSGQKTALFERRCTASPLLEPEVPADDACYGPYFLSLDPAGNIFVRYGSGVARIDRQTRRLRMVAGGGPDGSFLEDGAPANSGRFKSISGIAASGDGRLYVADESDNRVWAIDLASETARVLAGTGDEGGVLEGVPATAVALRGPSRIGVDGSGNVYFGEIAYARHLKVSRDTGRISFGGGSFDPFAVADDGRLYIHYFDSGKFQYILGRYDPASGGSSAILGGGTSDPWTADGLPATTVRGPEMGAVVESDGNVVVAAIRLLPDNGRRFYLMRIDGRTGLLETLAGGGAELAYREGSLPARNLLLSNVAGLALLKDGRIAVTYPTFPLTPPWRTAIVDRLTGTATVLSIPDGSFIVFGSDPQGRLYGMSRGQTGTVISVFDPGTGGLSRILGGGTEPVATLQPGLQVALGAEGLPEYFSYNEHGVPHFGAALDKRGDVYVTDPGLNRVYSLPACRQELGPFDLAFPADGATEPGDSLRLGWSSSDSAFLYDVLFDSQFPPKKVALSDLTAPAARLPGVEAGKTYYWQVRAKGDPLCPSVARTSGIRKIQIPARCAAPAKPTLSDVEFSGGTARLRFQAPGAAFVDLYLGSGPSLTKIAGGVTTTPYLAAGLKSGTAYRWSIVAHSACEADLTSTSSEGTFSVPGACSPLAPFDVLLPVDRSSEVPASVTLKWDRVEGAASYDLFLGGGADPEPFASGLVSNEVDVALSPGREYRWRVLARAACGSGDTGSPVRAFRTAAACGAPATITGLTSTKQRPFVGTSYALSWKGTDSRYRVERSRANDFSSGVEVTEAADTSVILVAQEPVSYYHRVISVSACGSRSQASDVVEVTASTTPAVITMTAPPRATVIARRSPGQGLPRIGVEVRNTGGADFVGFVNTSQRVPFFVPSETIISVRSGEVRVYYLQFSGVPPTETGQYEGVVSLVPADALDQGAYPQAPVSLTIANPVAPAPAPQTRAPVLEVDRQPVDAIRLSKTTSGDATRGMAVDIRNASDVALDLAADVLPDPWVTITSPDARSIWNAPPIPPGALRTVLLQSQRPRGSSPGAFSRYAYLTLRTIDGKSARLRVEESDLEAARPCSLRTALSDGETSAIVPSLVNAAAKGGGRYVSTLRITNLGPDAAPVELFYTPDSGDASTNGLDCSKVLYTQAEIPGSSVAALTDPVGELFGVANGSGQLEVRSPKIGQLRIQSVVDAPARGGGTYGFQLPTVKSGEGARQNLPYAITGVKSDDLDRTNLILTETSGQPSSVSVALFDSTGARLGVAERYLPPYGKLQFGVSELTGSSVLTEGTLEISANPGAAGSVMAIATLIDSRSGDASSLVARPVRSRTTSTNYAIPSVVLSGTFRSRVGIYNGDTRLVTYTLTYRGSTGLLTSSARTLGPRQEDHWGNVLNEAFGLETASFGPLFIASDSPHLAVTSRVSAETPGGAYGDSLDGAALDDPNTTGDSNRILSVDGLEGTADGDRSRGARTNLLLTEIAGLSTSVEVSLWGGTEQRIAPVARKTVALQPYQLVQLNDVFAELGVGRQDHVNVMCQVRPLPGAKGRVIAVATRIDNLTNDTKNLILRP